MEMTLKQIPKIAPPRFAEIAAKAKSLWDGFVDNYNSQFPPQSLFRDDYRATVNPMALHFGLHCVKSLGIQRLEDTAICLRQNLDGEQRAPSWLWKNEDGAPIILMDVDQVTLSFPQNEKEQKKIRTRLFLHEIGHIVLHLSALKNQRSAFHPGVSDDQEEEAWIFCNVIVGLALGCVARSGRLNNVIDGAWEKSC